MIRNFTFASILFLLISATGCEDLTEEQNLLLEVTTYPKGTVKGGDIIKFSIDIQTMNLELETIKVYDNAGNNAELELTYIWPSWSLFDMNNFRLEQDFEFVSNSTMADLQFNYTVPKGLTISPLEITIEIKDNRRKQTDTQKFTIELRE